MGQEWLKKDFDFDRAMENLDNLLAKVTYGFDRIEAVVMEAMGLWLKFDQFRSALREMFSFGPRAAEVAIQSPGRVPSSCPSGFQGRYTVRSGDTMFLIAQRFGVSLSALIAANPHISNPAVLFPGDVLCVPGAAPPACGSRVPASCPSGFQGRYTVRSGDTMFLIAQRFGVTLNALIAANPHISNPNVICPGDVLCVPGAPPPACGSRVPASCPSGFQGRYTVRSGDTMFLIAQRFGVTLNALIAANPHISNPNVICPGDVLCVPGAAPPACGSRVPASCPSGFQGRYTVRSGDTMFLIAQRFGVTLNALIAANPHISNPNVICPGDVLCVPGTVAMDAAIEEEEELTASRVPASCPPGFQGRYTVQAGDTMFLIAQRFGVTLNALIAANPHIADPNVIFPGDVLCVPGAPPSACGNRVPASCPAGFQGRYTVQAGDTMFLIAQRFGVSLNALIAANPHITNPNVICPGDVLCVPGAPPECGTRVPASCPAGFQGRYTVRAGDTMFLIAQRFGVSLNALIAANPQITNPNLICPGDVLCVPGAPPECGTRVPASCPAGFQGRYTVQAGDTMFLIAQRFGVSLNALIAANPHITNPNLICPGDVLCVPGAPPECGTRVPASCPAGFQGRYTVQAGDTMFLIAQRFGVSLNALIAANPHITNPNVICPGDVLCVPDDPSWHSPCCVILERTDIDDGKEAPRAVALVETWSNGKSSIGILAIGLRPTSFLGGFQGIVTIPGVGSFYFPLHRCQCEYGLWAGVVKIQRELTCDTSVCVRPVSCKGIPEPPILCATLEGCCGDLVDDGSARSLEECEECQDEADGE